MLKTFKPLAAISLALIAGTAGAVDIGFDKLTNVPVKTYKENGYVVTATKGKDLVGVVTTDTQLQSAGFTFEATAANKYDAFDLKSFYLDFGSATDVTLTYTVANQSGVETIDLGASSSLFSVNKNDIFKFNGLDDLTSFTLTGSGSKGPEFETDDIRVSAVPEPSSLALMFAGLGVVGTLVRRRRRA